MQDGRAVVGLRAVARGFSSLTRRPLAFPLFAAFAAMLLASPSMLAGWFADDYYHRVKLVSNSRLHEVIEPSFDIFSFFDGDPARTRRMMDRGITPWWTNPDLKGAFWRPLSTLTHWIDYRLWPDRAEWMHLHSLAWLGLFVFVAAAVFRRFCIDPVWAALATVLFAIDDAHAIPAAFIANRNALIAGVFGLLALLFHDKWRRERNAGRAWLGPLMYLLALLSGEGGVGALGYLLAHALVLDAGGVRQRMASLFPYVIVTVIWRAVWSGLGYGVEGVSIYVDPLAHPLSFLIAVAQRAPLYLLGQWAVPPSDIAILLPDAYTWVAAIGALVVLSLFVKPVVSVLRRDGIAAFWAVGMAFSLVPVCAVLPSDRVLVFVGVGSMALIARFVQRVFQLRGSEASRLTVEGSPSGFEVSRPSEVARAGARGSQEGEIACGDERGVHGGSRWSWLKPRRMLAVALVVIHGLVAPVGLALRAAGPALSPEFFERVTGADAIDASFEGRDLIVVNSPMVFFAHFILASCETHQAPLPRRLRVLAPAVPSVTIHRRDERTLVVRPERGFLVEVFDRLFRDGSAPMRLHDRVAMTGVEIEITELTSGARPAEATFRFDVALEDPSMVWLQWREDGYKPFVPPAVGDTVLLRASAPTPW